MKSKIGMVESIIIVNVVCFIPYAIYYITSKNVDFLLAYVSYFGNLNINHPNNYLSINDGAYWQFLTGMFLHGGFWHILFNMYGLYIFGKPLEYIWGKWKFLAFYLTTGVLANILSASIFLFYQNPVSLIGASGAVYAVMLAFACYYPETRLLLFFFIPMKVKWAILVFAVVALICEVTNNQFGIAHITHLFGFVFAFLYLLVFFRINAVQKMFFPKKDDDYRVY